MTRELNKIMVHSKGSWYIRVMGMYYKITKIFMNFEDPQQNVKDTNNYIEAMQCKEGVIKTALSYKIILLASMTDTGVESL